MKTEMRLNFILKIQYNVLNSSGFTNTFVQKQKSDKIFLPKKKKERKKERKKKRKEFFIQKWG